MDKVIAVMKALENGPSFAKVQEQLDQIHKKFHFNEDKYPDIPFTLTRAEIAKLHSANILTTKNDIAEKNLPELTPFEKLLYALAWKNGDLKKIKHIVKGILSQQDDETSEAIVFWQFGRFLNGNAAEPIVDQHVLRAFAVYRYRKNEARRKKYQTMGLVTAEELPLIKEYKDWLNNKVSPELRKQPNYRREVDKILFALGKYLKAANQ